MVAMRTEIGIILTIARILSRCSNFYENYYAFVCGLFDDAVSSSECMRRDY
jgi:hypothetical protein